MNDYTFQMLLHCNYTGDKNDIEQIHVEHLVDDDWHKLDINIHSPGFDAFIYAILSCQHMYFRNNAAEYGLILTASEGLITVITDAHRSIEILNVDFKGKLKKGEPTANMIDSIAARMGLCPVSINLKDIPDHHISISFESS